LLLVLLLWLVVSIVEDFLDLLLQLLSGIWVSELVLGNNLLELLAGVGEFTSNHESGWEDMVVVDVLDEWLNLGSS